VIVNTHSPLVVGECPDDSLVLAKSVEDKSGGRIFGKVVFRGVADTWRTKGAGAGDRLAKGDLVAYLSPSSLRRSAEVLHSIEQGPRRRIRDRADLQTEWLPGFGDLRVADE
jgi:hypothetical protein